MKRNEDKHIENLVDKMMKNQTLETPSFDFTSKVMLQVLESKKNPAFSYKPLISKQTTISIFCLTTLLIVLTILDNNLGSSKWLSLIQLGTTFKDKLFGLFHFSTVTMYGSVLGTIMLLGQMVFLQHYFNSKRH